MQSPRVCSIFVLSVDICVHLWPQASPRISVPPWTSAQLQEWETRMTTVRLATPADRAPLAQIFHDMETYYEGHKAVSVAVAEAALDRFVFPTILRAVVRHARERGITRIDWAVQVTNAPAVALYERVGARMKEGTRYMRLEGEALEKLATEDPA